MSIKKFNKIDVIILTILFLIAFYIWTSPIKDNNMPYGEADESYHFMIGDYQGQTDTVIKEKLPEYIGYRYYDKSALGPFKSFMLPPSHLNLGIVQVLGGERIVPVYVYEAIVSFFAMFAVYFICRKLFGVVIALLASFGTIFSFRTYMSYLWGQWPTITSMVAIPVVIYVFYKYLTKFYKKEYDNKLLFVLLALLLAQYVLHLQGFLVSAAVLFIMLILYSIKNKKVPLGKSNIYHVIIVAGIFLVVFFLTYQTYFAHSSYAEVSVKNVFNFNRIFSWYFDASEAPGYGAEFKTFSGEYGGLLLVPLLLGLLYVLLNWKKDKYLLLISWIIGLYLVMHLDVFLGSPLSRVIRFYLAEHQLFFILISMGVVSIPNYFKVNKTIKSISKIVLVVILGLFIGFTIGGKTVKNLDSSYDGLLRITPQQYSAAEWIRDNTKSNSVTYIIGTLTYPKERFIHAMSMKAMFMQGGSLKGGMDPMNSRIKAMNEKFDLDHAYLIPTYVMFDYSDLAYFKGNANYDNQMAALQNYEQDLTAGSELVYNQNNIHIYKLKKGVYNYEG